MRFFLSIIKNIIAVIAIICIIYFALKYAPFLRDQDWNPINHSINNEQLNNSPNNLDRPHNISTNGKRYVLEDNDILQNIPASQTRNVFKYIDKKEFMAVSGLGRMGYNDNYIAGQRNDEFIIYKFGSDQIKVYRTEIEMEQDLNALGQYIELKPFDAY
ncbi:DUF4930 family protein [Staphylococcus haemolyticus]|uniref:DUF4930 family protein n=2 Tax=Staphylococcus haemolyticus TaxID=1283 RepID=A0AB38PFI7_STAHA|nr:MULTISPECIES: DUF4930 family protein [Staphylococcus]SIK43430.1 Uncharacterised protein [Mycobacteroides abscessus subsp. abscessus]MBE7356173.1 DUF4930 family protein [Staphylococcus haemolyticus]MCE4963347.1 DUF4930 family protein [Staphylococcus haemolyticus]MCE4986806.1 DUF4930 family protein [Staphylococcus haemolyticus]MCE4991905.1 DUF4930 family protein [Staphylococcus haemolyticus]